MPWAMRDAEDAAGWAGGWAVIARVGTRQIAFPAGEVSSITSVPPLWRPPTAPRPVVGFLPLAGAVLPVLDAGILLRVARPARIGFYAHILVLPGAARSGAGLLVDRAEDTIGIAADAVLPLQKADTLNGCAIALAETGEGQVHVLSAARLLAAAETAALAALEDAAARRLTEWDIPA